MTMAGSGCGSGLGIMGAVSSFDRSKRGLFFRKEKFNEVL